MHFLFSDIFQRNKKLSYNKQYRATVVSVLASSVIDLRG